MPTKGGRHYPIHWVPEWNKLAKERRILSLFLRCGIYLSLPLSFGAPGSLVFGLRLESQHWFSWFSCFQTQTELNYCFPCSPFWRRQIGETSKSPRLHEPIPILRPNPYNTCNRSICYEES